MPEINGSLDPQTPSNEGSSNANPVNGGQERLFLGKYKADQVEDEFRKKDQQVTKFSEQAKEAQRLADDRLRVSKETMEALKDGNLEKIGELHKQDATIVNQLFSVAQGKTYEQYTEENEKQKYSTNPEMYDIVKRQQELEKQNAELMKFNEKARTDSYLNSLPNNVNKDSVLSLAGLLDKSLPLEKRLEIATNMSSGMQTQQNNARQFNETSYRKNTASFGSLESGPSEKHEDPYSGLSDELVAYSKTWGIDPKFIKSAQNTVNDEQQEAMLRASGY